MILYPLSICLELIGLNLNIIISNEAFAGINSEMSDLCVDEIYDGIVQIIHSVAEKCIPQTNPRRRPLLE